MVASSQTTLLHAPISLSLTDLQTRLGPVTFTIDDVLRMVAGGILPEDSSVELLNGSLVFRDRFDLKGGEVVAGAQHDYVVTKLSKLDASIDNRDRHIRTQTTLICGERHGPIPDAVILRGAVDDYREHTPLAADTYSVIEVADSSYERDAGEKLVSYARAGIVQYIIINLRNRTAEVYTTPDSTAGTYAPPLIISDTQSLALRVGDDEFFGVKLSDLLP
jgi:hypothetical protein